MNAHHFVEGVMVQILGEARLWYHSLEPINIDWQGLQNLFRQQYSKIGNTREQLFHAWRSFSFDKNTETIHVYVTCIRQVATLLGYGEPHILEVLKNTLPTKLYWIPFPIADIRQAVETAKRILTKEKIDRQLSGQTSSTPFMSIKGNHSRRVTSDTGDELGDKIVKLTVMIGKLVARDSGSGKHFKPKIYQSKRRGQNRGSYDRCSYDQMGYQNRYRSDSGDTRQYIQDRGIPRYEQNYRGGNLRGNVRTYQNLKDKSVQESTKIIIKVKVIAEVGIGTGLGKDHFLETLVMIETIGVQTMVGPGQHQEWVQIETESDATSVGNIIISQRLSYLQRRKRIRTTQTDA